MPSIHNQCLLLDTNVILRYADSNHAPNPVASQAIETLRKADNLFQIAPQNCIEFWNVATRPLARNGFGMAPEQADKLLRVIENLFPLLSDTATIYTEWRQLVTSVGVSGIQVHDARLVAIMRVNNISHILTFNTKDFARYGPHGITAIDPSQI